jgi:EDD domain protein, DegV family
MVCNIVCDSSCDLQPSVLQPDWLRLEVIPMKISVGGAEWPDNAGLSVPNLLEAMRNEKSASSTACPSPADFAQAFEAADRSICFTISGSLSGTYNSAVLARDMVLEDHPEKQICVIDSKSTAGVMVLLVRRAQELLSGDGAEDFEAVCNKLRVYQASLRTVFTLECYDNLIKNGRMRPLVGSLLHTLGIHVIADGTPQGTIHVAGKARGEQKTFAEIVRLMAASKDCTDMEVVISSCENLEGAMRLKQLILQELPVKNVTLQACRGLTSYYAMEKGLILGF